MTIPFLLLLAALNDISPTWQLTFTTFGPVHVGMTQEQVHRALGTRLVGAASGSEDCQQMYVARDPGISFMFEGGHLSRIDIKDAHHQTASGLHIGDSEERGKLLYRGRVRISPHKYIEGGHYLTIRSSDQRFALLAETDGVSITALRSGKASSVAYVEGCN